jgi:hypothetical protein
MRALLRSIVTIAALASPAWGQPAVTPRPNPAPRDRIEIEWRFGGEARRTREAEIVAVFEVENVACIPPDPGAAPGGVRLRPIHSVRVVSAPPRDGVLHATVWADAFAASDPFGLGLCRWRLADVRLTFRSPHHAVPFVASTGPEPNGRSGPLEWWYLEADFRRPPPAPITAVFGERPGFYPPQEATFALRATIRRGRTGAAP